ncbi:MAG: type I 3-dehydroquinate dehydratase [Spirochaetaceae bacterium]|nr:type I 3-dehydroquinate dehydratase [Spirochaetaceae bacterium]
MERPRICLCLTGKSLAEDLEILETYRNWIDMVELRVDYLEKDERLHIRKFPQLAGIPCILTIRRNIDGGQFVEGEASRTMLFARGLAFAEQDVRKNFTYVDFEEDYYVPSLQDAALAFGTRIIRSAHDMEGPIDDIPGRLAKMRITGFEIPKIACMPRTLADVTKMFRQAATLESSQQILCAMGPLGLPTRILADKLNSFLSFVSPPEAKKMKGIGHIDPIAMNKVYSFRSIDNNSEIFGIIGYPLEATDSPIIHNVGYRNHGMNAVYIPIRAETVEEALEFADVVGIKGLSVTVPHKEKVLPHLVEQAPQVQDIGACNTILRTEAGWIGYNTDAEGVMIALKEFLGVENLSHLRVAIIGAGGAARGVAYAVRQLKGRACIFNRTVTKAKRIADSFGFKWATLGPESLGLLDKYCDVIIQTTSKGMGASLPSSEENDPLYFYDFKGTELVYDIVYHPEVTPVMHRAAAAGCKVSNGYSMLQYQAYRQFKYFTGVDY